jgi:hypothetical protein
VPAASVGGGSNQTTGCGDGVQGSGGGTEVPVAAVGVGSNGGSVTVGSASIVSSGDCTRLVDASAGSGVGGGCAGNWMPAITSSLGMQFCCSASILCRRVATVFSMSRTVTKPSYNSLTMVAIATKTGEGRVGLLWRRRRRWRVALNTKLLGF